MTRLEHDSVMVDDEQAVAARRWAAWQAKRRGHDARTYHHSLVVFALIGAGALAAAAWVIALG